MLTLEDFFRFLVFKRLDHDDSYLVSPKKLLPKLSCISRENTGGTKLGG